MNELSQEEFNIVIKQTKILRKEIETAKPKKRRKLIMDYVDMCREFNKLISNRILRVPYYYITGIRM